MQFHKKNLNDNYKIEIRDLRCDNLADNVKFQKIAEEEGLGIQFEFNAPYTRQQNGWAQSSFATSFGRVRAMMNQSEIKEDL